MPSLNLILEEPAWPNMDMSKVSHVTEPIEIAALPGGMASGATSVAIRINLTNGQIIIAETSLALLAAAVRGIQARYPSPPGTGENAP